MVSDFTPLQFPHSPTLSYYPLSLVLFEYCGTSLNFPENVIFSLLRVCADV